MEILSDVNFVFLYCTKKTKQTHNTNYDINEKNYVLERPQKNLLVHSQFNFHTFITRLSKYLFSFLFLIYLASVNIRYKEYKILYTSFLLQSLLFPFSHSLLRHDLLSCHGTCYLFYKDDGTRGLMYDPLLVFAVSPRNTSSRLGTTTTTDCRGCYREQLASGNGNNFLKLYDLSPKENATMHDSVHHEIHAAVPSACNLTDMCF